MKVHHNISFIQTLILSVNSLDNFLLEEILLRNVNFRCSGRWAAGMLLKMSWQLIWAMQTLWWPIATSMPEVLVAPALQSTPFPFRLSSSPHSSCSSLHFCLFLTLRHFQFGFSTQFSIHSFHLIPSIGVSLLLVPYTPHSNLALDFD